MITATTKPGLLVGGEAAPFELVGLSTDTKPTDEFRGAAIVNGSTFIEMDTGDLYWFNAASGTWIK